MTLVPSSHCSCLVFVYAVYAPPMLSALFLHDALPISVRIISPGACRRSGPEIARIVVAKEFHIGFAPDGTAFRTAGSKSDPRSEEHTSELQSLRQLISRVLLKNITRMIKMKSRTP